ncbi:ATP-binding protein [Actinomadura rupiterrae]|uniref:ATP-binding protein n=1 Tax=Actinomadura rupiterrae TaxID=559627 RepID=UPI003556C38B|nr:anti-sigma regulatory factor (Ser/Thr protein kinase) [Actinomadura rupiterrae]
MGPVTSVRAPYLFDETLVAEVAAVGVARKGVWRALRGAGYCEELVESAGTVVTELASNAVRVACGEAVRVRLRPVRDEGGGVWVEVWDDQDAAPVPRPVVHSLDDIDLLPCDEVIGGWGLGIVASLSSRQEIRPTEPCGKWVAALIPCCRRAG